MLFSFALAFALRAPGNGRLAREELQVLLQLFNSTGGSSTWLNSSGWAMAAAGDPGAPDPCDGKSWFGIYDWPKCGWSQTDSISVCTAPDASGWRHLQVVALIPQWVACNNIPKPPPLPTPPSLPTPPPPPPAPAPHCGAGSECNGLVGSIQDVDLEPLRWLVLLGISANPELGGSIPASIATLTSLRLLYFNDGNGFSGTIPRLDALTNLDQLAIHDNKKMTGAIPPLEKLTNLVWLQITGQPLMSGPAPNLGALTRAWELDVSQCNLEGSIGNIDQLTSLKSLSLAGNGYTGSIPDLPASLTQINLAQNKLGGVIPPLGKLTSLVSLNLAKNILRGSIPALDLLRNLTTLQLNGNKISGSLPCELGLLTKLVSLDLSMNAISGTIPQLHGTTGLQVISLHHNALGGSIPPLQHLTQLQTLIIHENQLEGTVPPLPPSLIGTSVSGTHTVMINNNRLSCELPPGQAGFNTTNLIAVVTFGNRFSAPAPDWVPAASRAAGFMFVPEWRPWMWLISYGLGGALAFAGVVWWARQRRASVADPSSEKLQKFADASAENDATAAFGSLMKDSMTGLGALGGVATVLLLPAYLFFGTYYKCGEPMMHSSLAYLAETEQATEVAAILVCAFIVFSAAFCGWLQQKLARQEARAHEQRLGWHLRVPAWRAVLSVCVWLAATLLMSVPTVAYVLSHSLPTNNTLGISAGMATALLESLPFLLVAINTTLLPTLTRWVARVGLGFGNRMGDAAPLVTQLLLFGRLLTTVAVPVAAMLLLGQSCGERWKSMWLPCHGNSNEFNVPLPVSERPLKGQDGYVPKTFVFTTAELCLQEPKYGTSECVRSTIEALAPLFAQKMVLASCLQPACLLLFYESGMADWIARRRGGYRVRLDLEFAMVLTWVEMGLVYGLVLPAVLPVAALAMGVHWFTFRWLVVHRDVPCLPGTLPPTAYLQVALALQAVLATWFFNATASRSTGTAVTVVSLSVVVLSCIILARRRRHFRAQIDA
jgi:hypothetical protein